MTTPKFTGYVIQGKPVTVEESAKAGILGTSIERICANCIRLSEGCEVSKGPNDVCDRFYYKQKP